MPDRELTQGAVRARFRDLDPLSAETDNKAYALYLSLAPVTPLGHTRQNVSTTPETIDNLPAGTKKMHVYNLSTDTDVFFTDFTGQEPSGSLGFPIKADSWFVYDAEPTSDFKLATLSGSANLAFAFYA